MRSRQICGGPGSGTVKGGLAGRVQRAEKVLGGSPANLARVVAASDPSTIVEHIVWLRDASGAPAPPPLPPHLPPTFPAPRAARVSRWGRPPAHHPDGRPHLGPRQPWTIPIASDSRLLGERLLPASQESCPVARGRM